MVNVNWSTIEVMHCFIQNVSCSLGRGMGHEWKGRHRKGEGWRLRRGEGEDFDARRVEGEAQEGW